MNRLFLILLVCGMLFTGTINTLLNKLQDLTCVTNCSNPDTSTHKNFEQPLLQTINMFVGEIMCLFVYFILQYFNSSKKQPPTTTASDEVVQHETHPLIDAELDAILPAKSELTGWNQFYFLLPTLCDLTATTLMNIGLIFVSASVYQMLRGSVVLFTGFLSTVFLGRRHPKYRWFALVVVFLGVAIVGLSSVDFSSSKPEQQDDVVRIMAEEKDNSLVGIFMVILAQLFTASQFVIEEKIMSRFSEVPPIKAVGLEGVFGLTLTLIAVPLLHYTLGVSYAPGNVFDMHESWRQLMNPVVLWCAFGIIFSISIFNWCGLAVTKNISATSRSTIDTCRTLFIWMVSLVLKWESFKWLQVLGFVTLIYGTFVFNDIVPPPFNVDQPIQLPIEDEE